MKPLLLALPFPQRRGGMECMYDIICIVCNRVEYLLIIFTGTYMIHAVTSYVRSIGRLWVSSHADCVVKVCDQAYVS